MASKLGMTVDLGMHGIYSAHVRFDGLDTSGWAKAKLQCWIISTTKQATSINFHCIRLKNFRSVECGWVAHPVPMLLHRRSAVYPDPWNVGGVAHPCFYIGDLLFILIRGMWVSCTRMLLHRRSAVYPDQRNVGEFAHRPILFKETICCTRKMWASHVTHPYLSKRQSAAKPPSTVPVDGLFCFLLYCPNGNLLM